MMRGRWRRRGGKEKKKRRRRKKKRRRISCVFWVINFVVPPKFMP
jgi:hypothetical protein